MNRFILFLSVCFFLAGCWGFLIDQRSPDASADESAGVEWTNLGHPRWARVGMVRGIDRTTGCVIYVYRYGLAVIHDSVLVARLPMAGEVHDAH